MSCIVLCSGVQVIRYWTKYVQLDLDVLKCWQIGWPEKDEDLIIAGVERHEGTQHNLSVIFELEKERPGAVAVLRRDFGIANFGRYDKDILLKQVDRVEDVSRPYVLLATAQYDDNAESFMERSAITRFQEEISDDVNVRIVEFSTRDEMLTLIKNIGNRYGYQQKISMLMLFSHANSREIATDGTPEHDITREWMLDVRLHDYRDLFSDDAVFILAACETGVIKEKDEHDDVVKEEARYVGESFGQILGLTTIAPETVAHLKEIHARKINGKYTYDVTYTRRDEIVDNHGKNAWKSTDFKGRQFNL